MTRHETPTTRIAAAAFVAAVLVLLPPAAAVATADSHEAMPVTTYTRVALWEVDRDHWSAFVKLFEDHDQPIFEKLFADGLISEWGIDTAALHEPDGYTHSTWYSAPSMSALARAGEAYAKAWEALGTDVDAEFNAMVGKHRDFIMESEGMRSVAATLDGGYFQGHMVKLASWAKEKDFRSYWKNRMAPVYEQLLADGAIVAYGISTEAVPTENPAGLEWWYVMPDAGGFDKVEAAFDASWGEMDEEGRRARWLSILDTVDESSYRSWLSTIIHTQMAAH